MAGLKSCAWCGRIHPRDYNCGKRPARKSVRYESEAGRYTKAWEHKSKEIKERSKYLCAYCFAQGVYTYEDLETHHILKLRNRPDLLLEDTNLICLCRRHHKMADLGEIPADDLRALVRQRDSPGVAGGTESEAPGTDGPPS